MSNYLRLFSVLGIALLLSGSFQIDANACPKRFRTVKFIGRQFKKAFGAIGDGIHQGVQEVKSTYNEAKAQNSDGSDSRYTSYNNY